MVGKGPLLPPPTPCNWTLAVPRYVRSTWKERLSTPRRTSPFARATPSPTCEPLPPTAAHPTLSSWRGCWFWSHHPRFLGRGSKSCPTPTLGLSLRFPEPLPTCFTSPHSLHHLCTLVLATPAPLHVQCHNKPVSSCVRCALPPTHQERWDLRHVAGWRLSFPGLTILVVL